MVYLMDEDIRLLKAMPRGLPDLYFFRHPKGIRGATAGAHYERYKLFIVRRPIFYNIYVVFLP